MWCKRNEEEIPKSLVGMVPIGIWLWFMGDLHWVGIIEARDRMRPRHFGFVEYTERRRRL